jgi:hypothetical protein
VPYIESASKAFAATNSGFNQAIRRLALVPTLTDLMRRLLGQQSAAGRLSIHLDDSGRGSHLPLQGLSDVTEYSAVDIQGFFPAVEPTRTEKLLLLNGQNYIFDARGPKSPFGNRLLLPFALGRPEHVQGIRLKLRTGDRCFTITSDAILEWDETAGGWQSSTSSGDIRSNPYRWTHGYLNGVMFFCHPSVGILAYDLDDESVYAPHGQWDSHDAIAIDVNNGRLVAITPELFAWSSPSNGLDFTPALGGAGQQKISNHVAGSPIMVTSYTRGCLTWTTGGVMRSEFTGDVAVYHHRALNTEYRPVNSFCTCRIDDDTVIILDERGLFQSTGESPQPFAPLFNEFLIEYIQKNKLRQGNNLRLEWDELKRHMYVSASLSITSPLYEFCFVYYPPLDKWGQFCETHYGILPVKIDTSERADDYYGFVDAEGFVRYWLNTGSRELSVSRLRDAQRGTSSFTREFSSAPPPIPPNGTILSSTAAAYSYDPTHSRARGLLPVRWILAGASRVDWARRQDPNRLASLLHQ